MLLFAEVAVGLMATEERLRKFLDAAESASEWETEEEEDEDKGKLHEAAGGAQEKETEVQEVGNWYFLKKVHLDFTKETCLFK